MHRITAAPARGGSVHVARSTSPPRIIDLPRPSRSWITLLWTAGISAVWWWSFDSITRSAADADAVPAAAIGIGVALALAFKLAGNLVETAFYSGWWLLRDARIPFGALWTWILSLSLLDAVALVMPWAFEPKGEVVRLAFAVLFGANALLEPGEVVHGSEWMVFGGFGVLAVARIVATAWVQSKLACRRLRGPLALTACAWLAVRVATWWLGDLLRGHAAVG
jgi:hypothetical protein